MKTNWKKIRFAGIVLLLLATFLSAQPSGWSHHNGILLNTTSSGANVSGDVTDFPILVRLNSSNFTFSQAKSDGADIRFTKLDSTTNLSYEIERWDAANELAEIWVKVDTVYGDDSSYIFMWWGNSGASSNSSGSDVFELSNDFRGVWHLTEDGNGTAGEYKDASENGKDGTGNQASGSNYPDSATGLIGLCNDFNESNTEYISIDAAISIGGNTGTISGWGFLNAGWTGDNFLFGRNTSESPALRVTSGASYDYVYAYVNDDADFAKEPVSDDTWYHYALVYRGSSSERDIYINGVLDTTIGAPSANWTGETGTFVIGERWDGDGTGANNWDGMIDEVRVSSSNRSANWIKLCYENQKVADALTSFSTPPIPPDPPEVGYTVQDVIPAAQCVVDGNGVATITFKVRDDTASSFTLNTFEYSVNGGSSFSAPANGDASACLSTNWEDNSYSSATTFGAATSYSFTWNTRHADCSGLAGIDQDDVQIRFKAHDGSDYSDYGTSESFTVNNYIPPSNKRYWIATSGRNWNDSTYWSQSSGGSGGASVPGAGDTAYFDANGGGNCLINDTAEVKLMIVNGYTGAITLQQTRKITISDSAYLNFGTGGQFKGTNWGDSVIVNNIHLADGTFKLYTSPLCVNGSFTYTGTGYDPDSNGTVVFKPSTNGVPLNLGGITFGKMILEATLNTADINLYDTATVLDSLILTEGNIDHGSNGAIKLSNADLLVGSGGGRDGADNDGRIILSGTGNIISSGGILPTLIVDGDYTSTGSSVIDLYEDLVISSGASLNLNGRNLDCRVNSSVSNSGTLRLLGSETVTFSGGFDTTSGTVQFTGSGTRTIPAGFGNGSGISTFYNLTVNSGTVLNPSGSNDVHVRGALINNGTINLLSSGLDVDGALTNTNIMDISGNVFSVGGAVSNTDTIRLVGSETLTFTSGFDNNSGLVHFYGGGSYDLPTVFGATPLSFYHLVINDSTTVDINGSNLSVNGTILNKGTLKVNGDETLTFAGGFDSDSGGTVEFDGNRNSTIPAGFTGGAFCNLTISAGDTLDVNNGTLNVKSTISNEGVLCLRGRETLTFSGGFDLNSGAVLFDGDVKDTVPAVFSQQLYNLIISSNDTLLTTNSILLNIFGDITIGSAAVLDVVAGGLVTASGKTFSNDGTLRINTLSSPGFSLQSGFDSNSGSVELYGAGTFSSASAFGTPAAFYDLSVAASSRLSLNGTGLTVNGTFSNDGELMLLGSETFVFANGFDGNSGTVRYTGGSGPYTVSSAFDSTFNNLILNSGVILNLNGDSLRLNGTLDNNGTIKIRGGEKLFFANGFDVSQGKVEIDGPAAVQLPAGLGRTFFNLDITADDTLDLNNDSLTVVNSLNNYGNIKVRGGEAISLPLFDDAQGKLIIDGDRQVALDPAFVSTYSLIISSGDTLSLNGRNLSVNGSITNSGALRLTGSEVVTFAQGFDTTAGTVIFDGDSRYDFPVGFRLPCVFNNVVITADDTLKLNSSGIRVVNSIENQGVLELEGGETVSFGGGFDVNSGTVLFSNSGENTIPAGFGTTASFYNMMIGSNQLLDASGRALSVSGTFRNNGIFRINGDETITLTNGYDTTNALLELAGTGTYNGIPPALGTYFQDLLISGSGATWTFTDSLTTAGVFACTTNGCTLNFTGGTGYNFYEFHVEQIVLKSTNSTDWRLYVSTLPNVAYDVEVSHSDASGGILINAEVSADSGNNTNWDFGGDTRAPEIIVYAPAQNDSLGIGFSYNIKWTANDPVIDSVMSRIIRLSTNGGASWTILDSAVSSESDSLWQWDIDSMAPSVNCLISVSAWDNYGNLGSDTSGLFSILDLPVTVIQVDTPTVTAVKGAITGVMTRRSGSYEIQLPGGTYRLSGADDTISISPPASIENIYAITITAADTANRPVFYTNAGGVVFHVKYDYVTIQDLEIITTGTAFMVGDGSLTGSAREVTVQRCYIHPPEGAALQGSGVYAVQTNNFGVDSLRILNCLITDSCVSGFHVQNSGPSLSGLQIVNNSILLNPGYVNTFGVYLNGVFNVASTVLQNNLITNASTAAFGAAGGSGSYTVSNCLLYGNAASYSPEASFTSQALLTSEPILSGDKNRYFHTGYILSGSPAIDAGASSAAVPTVDIWGTPRSGTPDIGAVEYNGYSFLDTVYISSAEGDNNNRGDQLSAPLQQITYAYRNRVPSPLYYPIVFRLQGDVFAESDGQGNGVVLTGKNIRSGSFRLEPVDDGARPVLNSSSASEASVLLRGNNIFIDAVKIHTVSGGRGVLVDTGSHNIDISRCLVRPITKRQAYNSAVEIRSSVTDVKIENCLIDYLGTNGAIFLNDDNAAASTTIDSVTIVYNSIYMENDSGYAGVKTYPRGGNDIQNVTVKYNIFDSPKEAAFVNVGSDNLSGTNLVHHNCIYNSPAIAQNISLTVDTTIKNITDDELITPMFASTDPDDYNFLMLDSASICILFGSDNADGLSSGIDYLGNVRPDTVTAGDSTYYPYVLGAFESSSSDRDSVPNVMTITCVSPIDSTAIVSFVGLNNYATREVDSIGLWLGLGQKPARPDPTDNMAVLYNLARMKSSGTGDTYVDTIRGLIPLATYWFAAAPRSVYGDWTAFDTTRMCSLIIHQEIPPNPYSLTADTATYTTIQLSWSNGDTLQGLDVDSIGIWYYAEPGYYPDSAHQTDALTGYLSDTVSASGSYTITGLSQNTTYYFSMFVRGANGVWSLQGGEAKAELTTMQSGDAVAPENNIRISAAIAPSASDEFRITWEWDGSGSQSSDSANGIGMYETGVSLGIKVSDTGFVNVNARNRTGSLVYLDTSDELITRENFEAQKTYYITAALRDSVGNWSDVTPACTASLYLPLANPIVSVVLVSDPPETIAVNYDNGDTLWIGWTFSPYTDGRERDVGYYNDSTLPDVSGLKELSTGKELHFFDRVEMGDSTVYLRMQYQNPDPAVPVDEVRLYFYSKADDAWSVVYNSHVDSANGLYYVVASVDIEEGSFRIMWDSVPPAVTVLNLGDKLVEGFDEGTEIIDTLIVDNEGIANVKVTLEYKSGGENDSRLIQDLSTVTNDTTLVEILESKVNEKGLWAFLTISDGVHDTTVNLSYPVKIKNQTMPVPAAEKYELVSVPFGMDEPRAIDVFNNIWNEDYSDGAKEYDPVRWRLFKYEDGDYTEMYDKDNPDIDDPAALIETGKGYWIITKKPPATVDVGSGKTITVGTSYSIPLQEGWNDFGIPFMFVADSGIYLGDILDSSNLGGRCYFYNYDANDGWEPMFQNDNPDQPVETFALQPWKGYSVYCSEAETLKIPAISALYSDYHSSAKRRALVKENKQLKDSWHLNVSAIWRQGKDLYNGVGSRPNARGLTEFAPKPFSPVEDVVMHTYHNDDPAAYSFKDNLGDGNTWTFLMDNQNKKDRKVQVRFSDQGVLPEGYRSVVWNPLLADEVLELPADSQFTVSFQGGDSLAFKVLAGSEAYLKRELEKLKLPKQYALRSNYPNPFNPITMIRFEVPFRMRGADVALRIYNVRGQLVKTVYNDFKPGYHLVKWNGRDNYNRHVSSGIYFLRMTARERGKNIYVKTRKMALIK